MNVPCTFHIFMYMAMVNLYATIISSLNEAPLLHKTNCKCRSLRFNRYSFFRLNFASRTGDFQVEGAGGTSSLNTGWCEFGLFQIDWHARLMFFFVDH